MGSCPDTDIDPKVLILAVCRKLVSMDFVNPFTPKSDQHLISPYNISLESHEKVTRIKEMITN